MTITGMTRAGTGVGLAVNFVVEFGRFQLSEIVRRVRDGWLRTNLDVRKHSCTSTNLFNQWSQP